MLLLLWLLCRLGCLWDLRLRIFLSLLLLLGSFCLDAGHLVTQLIVLSDPIDAYLPNPELEQLIEVELSIKVSIHYLKELLKLLSIH